MKLAVRIVLGLAAIVVIGVNLARIGRTRVAEQAPPSPHEEAPSSYQIAEDSEPESYCPDAPGTKSVHYGLFELEVERTADDICAFRVWKSKGPTLAMDEGALAISAQYRDLDNDILPELIVVADSGGSGLHADTFVFTSKPQPRLVAKYDGCATRVRVSPDGTRALQTCDLGMNMFESVCNACSPRPAIFYVLEKGELRNVNANFVSEFDKEIEEEEQALKPEDVKNFLETKSEDDNEYIDAPARPIVLRIAVDYIFSGREAKAREVINKNWPAFDRERILQELTSRGPR